MASKKYINGQWTELENPTEVGKTFAKGTKSITANGTYDAEDDNLDGYESVTVNVPSEEPNLQTKSVTPTESAQEVVADDGYDGLEKVNVGAIPSTYIGSGITKKSAQTYTPSTTNQTIASGQYLNGVQTIAGDADLIGSNIISTANIFGVQGTVVINKYYTGSSDPSSSLGANGDLYLKV